MTDKQNKDNGGPAFPGEKDIRFGQDNDCNEGMTLRDYIAAKAMQALINHYGYETLGGECKELEATSFEIADEMIAARNA